MFSTIPVLRNAEFVRYGIMHRDTCLNSPRSLDRYYRVKKEPRVCFVGQITGVEGCVEPTVSGFPATVELARRLEGKPPVDFPQEAAVSALTCYISDGSIADFQPMNINFGIIPPLNHRVKSKRNKNTELSKRVLELLDGLDWRWGGHKSRPYRNAGRPKHIGAPPVDIRPIAHTSVGADTHIRLLPWVFPLRPLGL